METTTTTTSSYQFFIPLFTVAVLLAAAWYGYNEGYMDPLIEKIGEFVMKAEAEAEVKKLQAQGLKSGEDLIDSEFSKDNPQAADIKAGVGSFGGLKKSL